MSPLKIFSSVLIGISCIASTGLAQQSPAKQVKAIKLALNWKAEPQFGGFYAAHKNGHFKSESINAEIIEGGAGTPVVQMIAAGKMDFGIASADEVVISRANGSDVVALFAAYQTNPQGIMVREDAGVATLKDLFARGDMTLALQKGLPYALYLQKKFAPVKVKLVPYSGGVAGLLNDKNFAQQCFVTSEPIAARKQNAKVKSFLVADEGYNPYTTVLITRGEVLKAQPELVASVVRAVRKGWSDYLQNPEATNAVMAKLNKAMDQQTFKESAAAQKGLIETDETKKLGLGVMTEARWSQLITQLSDMKVIRKKPEAHSVFKSLP